MASYDVELLSFWASPFSMRAELALCAKGIPYTDLPEDITPDPSTKSPLLLQSNPVYKKVPVLLHRHRPVCESSIIVQYLDEAFPSPDGNDLLPKDPYHRAIARFWADFVDNKVTDSLTLFLVRTAGEAQMLALQQCKEHLTTLEGALETVAKESPYFGGASVGYVDIILGPFAAWYDAFERAAECNLSEAYPRLFRWIKAIRGSAVGECLPAPERVTEFIKMRREIIHSLNGYQSMLR